MRLLTHIPFRPAALLAACLILASASVGAAGRGAIFEPSADVMAEIDLALARALENDQLGLIILGANWCHDSRALAARTQRGALKKLLDQRYQTVLVDVGFYEAGSDVVQRFGSPTYYATPTVLIVDPETGVLVNDHDRHQWGHADSISNRETLRYFEAMADQRPPPGVEQSGALQELLEQIDGWERNMARRVDAAYQVTGPLLRQHKAGDTPRGFYDRWDEVAEFRNAVPHDKQALIAEARRRVAAGETGITLDYPSYPAFSWE
ncbi:MAG: hypothetical protein QNJ40_03300 [Xanthomonadales bacterium]|nr:hypothetical protein [Xanthomonadales bacterium]